MEKSLIFVFVHILTPLPIQAILELCHRQRVWRKLHYEDVQVPLGALHHPQTSYLGWFTSSIAGWLWGPPDRHNT